MKRRESCTNVCLSVTGTFLVIVGVVIFFNFDVLYDNYLNSAMRFDVGTEPFNAWRVNDPPLIMNLYIFNWTNSEDLTTPGVKPKFEEVGPYRFIEIKEKINLNLMTNNTVFYQHRTFFYFDAENSERQLDEIVTTINIVPVAVAYKVRHAGYFARKSVSFSLSRLSNLIVKKTAGEVLFHGYEENFLKFISTIPLSGVLQDKFAMFYDKNGTAGSDGSFSMWTKNDENFGQLLTWNGSNRTNMFEGHCNDVKGSAGEFHALNPQKNKLTVFSAELCKYADFEYEKEVMVKGIKGYKYSGKNIFDNGTLHPENSCFCVGECIPTGVFNVSSCRKQSPIFLSMPHFYGADPYYTDAVEGLQPNQDHELFITLEPKTGVVLNIGLKMQVNVLLQPVEDIQMFEYVPKVFFPIFYFSQEVFIKDTIVPRLQLVQRAPDYSNIAVMIMISFGLLCFIGMGVNAFFCRKYRSEKYHLPRSDFGDISLH